MNTKKIVALGVFCLALGAQAVNATAQFISDARGESALIKALEKEVLSYASSSNGLQIKGGDDLVMEINGKMRADYAHDWHTTMLNSELPDDTAAFKHRLDFNPSVRYGEERYGSPAVEIGASFRAKTIGGNYSAANKITSEDVRLVDGSTGSHSHKLNQPYPWMRQLWVGVCLNNVFDWDADTRHVMRAGMFNFELGRGIALGSYYGQSKEYLGVLSNSNDLSPWGILFSGEILKNTLSYDFYYAKLEERGASFKDTMSREKSHIVGRKESAHVGVAQDNDLVAARLKYKFKHDTAGKFDSEMYLLYNEASSQQIELPHDSKSTLFTYGSAVEWKKSNWEAGAEFAVNFGRENVYAIDRNVVDIARSETSTNNVLREQYSKVILVNNGEELHNKGLPLTSTNEDIVAAYTGTENSVSLGSTYTFAGKVYDIQNASGRFRPAFDVDYTGWAAVADVAYNIPNQNTKLALAIGSASGDANPHAAEVDTKYNGFIGLHENFDGGKRVQSVFVLNARKMKRPLSFTGTQDKVQNDVSFSDITYLGGGVHYKWQKDWSIKANVLGYFKNHTSKAYTYAKGGADGVSDVDARNYLGSEANAVVEYEALKGLKFAGEFAVFLPGSYYTDIKGTPLSDGKVLAVLDEADTSGVEQAAPRSGNDVAYHLNVGVQYSF